jgi:hypothetical protein
MGFSGHLAQTRVYRVFMKRVFLVVFAGLSSFGCGGARIERAEVPPAQTPPRSIETHDAIIYVDEAMLGGPFAIIGGRVENTSGDYLRNVFVELELERRADGTREKHQVKVRPEELGPGQKGSYALRVRSEEWSDSRLTALRSETSEKAIAFKLAPGNRRPPERIVARQVMKPAEATRAKKPRTSEEFINSPDTPISVP